MNVERREQLMEACRRHASALDRAASLLFFAGYTIGPDRVTKRTQHGFGDDRVVALGYVVEIGADLALSSVKLLEGDHRYSSNALLRQLIEVEYLVAAFGDSPEDARVWLDATDDQIRVQFSPGRLRQRAQGRFRYEEYQSHCALGGHPNPKARTLLPRHSAAVELELLWTDLDHHLSRLCVRLESTSLALQAGGAALPLFHCPDRTSGVTEHDVDYAMRPEGARS
jgi:hypothetical protein